MVYQSHQNKFHATALRQLTERFASIRAEDISHPERDLFEYFAELYKNSNRGIKGRGKDRKISGVKKARPDSKDRKHNQGASITSPNGSSTSNGDHNYEFDGSGSVQMEEDDDGSVGSPGYEQHQQQLPPLRPVNDMGPPGMGMMYDHPMGLHPPTHMAKYHLDRKFQTL